MTQGVEIPYTQSVSSQEVPPPYHFPNVTVNAFVWQVELDPIQAYCDTYFNLGDAKERGFIYRPAAFWPYAMLLFINYPAMVSSARKPQNLGGFKDYRERGIVSQTEVFVALPVVRYGLTPERFVFESTLEWVLPFIVVGNPMSAVCGREMLGLEKMLADIETRQGELPGSFAGDVYLPGWPENSPGVTQRTMGFLNVKTNPVLPTFWGSDPLTSSMTLLQSREAGWLIDGLVSANDFLDTATFGMMPTTMRTVSLKQFRDAADPSRAVYQALLSCRSRYTNIENFRFYNEQDVEIVFYDNGSFGEILRVFLQIPDSSVEHPTNDPFVFAPKAAFRFNATIDFDELRKIHTFPIDRGPGVVPARANSDLIANWARPWAGLFGYRKQ